MKDIEILQKDENYCKAAFSPSQDMPDLLPLGKSEFLASHIIFDQSTKVANMLVKDDAFLSSVEMRFLSPLPKDNKLILEARVIQKISKKCVIEVSGFYLDILIFSANFTYAILDKALFELENPNI
ncbi:MAG: hypothetical protein E7K04_02670 [Helicobacter sp.]|nr:hypothetical protein [Helicobacter sp.]